MLLCYLVKRQMQFSKDFSQYRARTARTTRTDWLPRPRVSACYGFLMQIDNGIIIAPPAYSVQIACRAECTAGQSPPRGVDLRSTLASRFALYNITYQQVIDRVPFSTGGGLPAGVFVGLGIIPHRAPVPGICRSLHFKSRAGPSVCSTGV